MFMWIRKILGSRPADDLFARKIEESLGGVRKKTEEFATGLVDYAMEKEIAELRERITKLEAVILPLRNGAPARH